MNSETALTGFRLQADPWLAGILGKSTHKVIQEAGAKVLLPDAPHFLFAKVPCREIETARLLTQHGFALIDTNLVFSRAPMPGKHDGSRARFVSTSDRNRVKDIAGSAFVYSRFHLDSNFTTAMANQVKAAWADNFFEGARGEHMVVAEVAGRVAGFLQLLHDKSGTLTIDLIATDTSFQKKGLAREMISFAEANIPGVKLLRVGTQVANVPSVRFYENAGFRLEESHYVFHLHGKGR